ncbi:MAG: sulfotransferase [Alphaproteobacteria bacterium]|nr:sulfotransferase [Alphaproteobacteria bacterium]
MPDSSYGVLDRLLHRLALGVGPIAEMSFDLDQKTLHNGPEAIVLRRHVFVAGLARAGTTVLMRQFHSTSLYRSLTYRDMPFVLAPNLWQRLSSISKRDIQSAERAHGDGILVDADSPESFEEVFWRIFTSDEYLQTDKLIAHRPDEDTIRLFTQYINAIMASAQPGKKRYLSKNNNNILRLDAIHRAFPNALILVPFRAPMQQAQSLLRQHRRFIEQQEQDSFIQSYMSWLGHHEFGRDHRPFEFDGKTANPYPATSLNYWLELWCETYEWLEKRSSPSVVFVSYEDLCGDEKYWARLAKLAEIPVATISPDSFSLSHKPPVENVEQALESRAEAIHARLTVKSREI